MSELLRASNVKNNIINNIHSTIIVDASNGKVVGNIILAIKPDTKAIPHESEKIIANVNISNMDMNRIKNILFILFFLFICFVCL